MHRSKHWLRISHSISSSASTKSRTGIVTPRALAVLRLMTSSNLVGCCTASSAGFAPRHETVPFDVITRAVHRRQSSG